MKTLNCSVCGTPVKVGSDTVGVTCGICASNKTTRYQTFDKQPKKRPPSAVTAEARRECANMTDGKHLDTKPCLLLSGKRCDYFEKAVLPAAEERVLEAYKKWLAGGEIDMRVASTRRCKCGARLRPKRRMCDKCSKAARRKSYRDAQKKRR